MGTFLVKWTAASLVTGENKFLLALSSAGERVSGALPGEQADGFARIPMAVAANLTMMFGGEARVEPVRVATGMAVSFLVLGSVFYLSRSHEPGIGGLFKSGPFYGASCIWGEEEEPEKE